MYFILISNQSIDEICCRFAINIIHEVGYILMFAHSQQGSHNSGHDFANLLPYAVMNTGLPVRYNDGSYDQVAWTVADHDKSCLRGKWGN